MKQLFLGLLLFAAACGSSNPAAEMPAGSDLRADVMVTNNGGTLDAEAMFYFSSPVAAGERTSAGKEFIAVSSPTLNGSAMTQTASPTGQPVYKAEPGKWVSENTVTAKLGGKEFVGKTHVDKAPAGKMTTITLMPKQ